MPADITMLRRTRLMSVLLAAGLVLTFLASPSAAFESSQPREGDVAGWERYGATAAEFDAYRITDGDLMRRRAVLQRFVEIRKQGGADLDSKVETATADFEREKERRSGLELEAKTFGGRLSILAVEKFKSSGAGSPLPAEATSVEEVRVKDRTERAFDRTVEDSARDYKVLKTAVGTAIDDYDAAATHLNEISRAKELHAERLQTALEISERFRVSATERDSVIAQRSSDAIAAEKAEPQAVVGPFTVHQSLAEPLTRLLEDAAADGISFAGWGQRPVHRQIELRRSNCGNSEWAMFDKSSGTCGPPTARPGHSQHELGLAIDFTQGGSVLTRSSSGFHWLRANAAKYGLRNLPSEPWHWSTTGR